MGNKVVSFYDKWGYLGWNKPTKEADPIKVKDMILQQAMEERQANNAAGD